MNIAMKIPATTNVPKIADLTRAGTGTPSDQAVPSPMQMQKKYQAEILEYLLI